MGDQKFYYFELPNFVMDILSRFNLINQSKPTEPQIVQIFCIVVALVGIIVFCNLLIRPAAYGRYAGAKRWLGFGVNARLAWFLQESPSFFIPATFCLLEYRRRQDLDINHLALVGLFSLHYWQRTFIYSCLIRGGKPTPIVILAMAFTFCSVNGYIQARNIQLQHYPDAWLKEPVVIVGFAIFFIGLAINIHADHILRNLRKPGETGYKIPKGGLYDYVTAANYFGEAVEWFGFFLAAQTLAAAVFSFFTVANLLPRAIAHQRWYKSKFEDYPKDRKVFFPFLF